MNVKELRIGNIVTLRTASKNEFTRINSADIWHGCNLENPLHRLEFNSILPIPLNEEWLIKLGYKLVNVTPEFKSFKGEPYLYLNNDGSVKASTGKEMYFVHELQNRVFSLTGKELDVKS